ncbi:hypothetical protein CPB85DRAFT_1292851 [Mucidula mucida]|nr:hypothetical protein CPB85DRAFT_1292851 [Mucidula mucida]
MSTSHDSERSLNQSPAKNARYTASSPAARREDKTPSISSVTKLRSRGDSAGRQIPRSWERCCAGTCKSLSRDAGGRAKWESKNTAQS